MESNFNRGAHCIYSVKVHLMFPVYKRKSMLEYGIYTDMMGIMRRVAGEKGLVIDSIECDRNHMHLLVSIAQDWSISRVVHWLKQQSAKEIWDRYNETLAKGGFPYRKFWSNGYFAESIGRMDEGAIKAYIDNQGTDKI